MVRMTLVILAVFQFIFGSALATPSRAQEWAVRVKPRGILRVVDLSHNTSWSIARQYAEGLVTVDKDNNWVPCLAEDWRWLNDRTIEFKLRRGVFFHNGEEFNAKAVRINWEEYRRMESPAAHRFLNLPDETLLELTDDYTVRFTSPEPDGLAIVKLSLFHLFAPAFFAEQGFDEKNWLYLSEAGPWGTGPFKFVEGSNRLGMPSKRVVLEAYEHYWDRRYPQVQRVIFENALLGDRKEAMRLCRETEGEVDIVSFIRPLDTLKVAESPFAKVVKSRDVCILFAGFNQRKKDSKWRDVRLRKAMNYAINREELLRYAAMGNAYNLGGFIPPGAFGHNPNLTPYTYDTTKARALLAEAGYPDGFEMNIITRDSREVEAQIISKMLERVGIKVNLDVLTGPEEMHKTYIPLMDKPPEEQEWDMAIWDPDDWSGHTATSILVWPTEQSDWRDIVYDPGYEEMWKDMARTVDPEAQEQKVREMVQYYWDHVWRLFIYTPLTLYAVNKEVNFVPQKTVYLRLKETSVSDNHWSVREKKE